MSGCPLAIGQVYQFPNDRMARPKTAGKRMSENKTKLITDHAVAKRVQETEMKRTRKN